MPLWLVERSVFNGKNGQYSPIPAAIKAFEEAMIIFNMFGQRIITSTMNKSSTHRLKLNDTFIEN